MKRTAKNTEAVTKPMVELVEENIINYGQYIIENRAIPDFRSCKPVQRRILWSLYKLGIHHTVPFRKAALVSGFCMGNFHPHGSAPIEEALVGLVNQSSSLVEGEGNWGFYGEDDQAGAARYIECRLSALADKFLLNDFYLKVVPMVQNYDASTVEPLYLPSLVPELLFNGASGIAVAVTTMIPSFEPKGVLYLTKILLSGKKITPELCEKHLKFKYQYGGELVSELSNLENLWAKGQGKAVFTCNTVVNELKKTIIITGITPYYKSNSMAEKFLEHPAVNEVGDESDKNGIKIVIKLKRTYTGADFKKAVDQLKKMMNCTINYKMNITHRINEDVVKFEETSIIGFLEKWVKYRIQLEIDAQKYHLADLEKKLAYQFLMKKAIDNLDKLFAILKRRLSSRDLIDQAISKDLKITLDEANTISGLAYYKLSKMSQSEIDQNIKNLQLDIKITKGYIAKPYDKVLSDITEAEKFFK